MSGCQLARADATPAGELYARMLRRWAPAPIDVKICYPSDGPVDDATTCVRLAAEYAGVAWTGCNLTVMHGVQEWRDGETRTCLRASRRGLRSLWLAKLPRETHISEKFTLRNLGGSLASQPAAHSIERLRVAKLFLVVVVGIVIIVRRG